MHPFVDSPTEYAEIWKKRYAELLGHGVPDEQAKKLASELAAAAVLASVHTRNAPPPVSSEAAPGRPVRVLRIAKFDGYGLLIMGVPSIIISCISFSVVGIVIGVVVTGCGCLELDGHRHYTGKLPGARSRLMGSQIILIVMAWAYAGWSLLHPEPLAPEITELIKESGEETASMMALVERMRLIIAAAICGITLLYQGGMSVHYWLKTRVSP
jgi:hypothetical protein